MVMGQDLPSLGDTLAYSKKNWGRDLSTQPPAMGFDTKPNCFSCA